MLIKGEKWACEACIRGHRVSNCQHADRPLSHINKKGRPVSQCPHCRGLRKSRTTHTKCECGEKGHTKAECPTKEASDNQVGNRKQCCCGHGSRCTCANKRDSNLETVPEVGPPRSRASSNLGQKRPHLATTKADDALSGFPTRHTKNRVNDTCKRGVPYSIPRSHTVHASSDIARHSADHLPLPETGIEQDGTLAVDSITKVAFPVRLVRSEHGSPANAPLLGIEEMNNGIPHLDISVAPLDPTNSTPGLFDRQDQSLDQFYSPETEAFPETPNFNVPPVDWSTFGLPFNPSDLHTTFSQPPSYASFDNSNFSHSNLTHSSSGELSEVEDIGLATGIGMSNPDKLDVLSASDGSGNGMYRLSPSSCVDFSQSQMLSPSDLQSVDIDAFLKAGAALSQPPQPFDIIATSPRVRLNSYQVPQDYSSADSQTFSTTAGDDSLLVSQEGAFVSTEPNTFMWDPATYSITASANQDDIPLQQHTQWF
ncbi:copper fist DNA binding domain-containing protein [Histoplasma capsulatum var. duboisii H88]|uniref:Copper fist DNA binding domain-containing protein n=1 Tax=Ajellomyces capsulatus (strain H88) TaxID=544711 RepID=F0UTM7_AJEC8|nr:copper fist DNA binding domain-containing protein [Histoplasma capsulatum var. duboisii H88]QSS57915.1 copper fist DNA binding domain-containing protein [Histoplasma capsulatum var. duboisii H88]